MSLDPLDEFVFQEDPLLANLVRGEPLAHQLVQGLMAHAQKLLSFLEGQVDSLDRLALVLRSCHIDANSIEYGNERIRSAHTRHN